MPAKHDYGKTRAFSATCPRCGREARGLSTDGRVKTIVRSCSTPGCGARELILNRDRSKDGPLYRVRPFGDTFDIYNFLSGTRVARFLDESKARVAAAALTGNPPPRRGRTR